MTDTPPASNDTGLDPITEMAAKLDAMTAERDNLKKSNEQLLDSNRKLIAEKAKTVIDAPETPPASEDDPMEVAARAFFKKLGIKVE